MIKKQKNKKNYLQAGRARGGYEVAAERRAAPGERSCSSVVAVVVGERRGSGGRAAAAWQVRWVSSATVATAAR
jgi:hypothetical protein